MSDSSTENLIVLLMTTDALKTCELHAVSDNPSHLLERGTICTHGKFNHIDFFSLHQHLNRQKFPKHRCCRIL